MIARRLTTGSSLGLLFSLKADSRILHTLFWLTPAPIQSFHSDISGNPSLLPRYFPRTVLTAPPPYVDPAEGSSVATQSDLSTMELHPQTPLPFQSTPAHRTMGAILPVAMYDAEPSDLPPPFTAISSPSSSVHTSPLALT